MAIMKFYVATSSQIQIINNIRNDTYRANLLVCVKVFFDSTTFGSVQNYIDGFHWSRQICCMPKYIRIHCSFSLPHH